MKLANLCDFFLIYILSFSLFELNKVSRYVILWALAPSRGYTVLVLYIFFSCIFTNFSYKYLILIKFQVILRNVNVLMLVYI